MLIGTQFYSPLLSILLFVLFVSLFWLGVYVFNRRYILSNSSGYEYFPRLSVVVPAYNESGRIGNLLDSLMQARYPRKKLEIIVVNDGSTDETASVVKKYPVKLISHGKNQGKIDALNAGVKAAKGEIVVTLDSDVEVLPHTLTMLVQKFKDKRIGAVAGSYKAKKMHSKNNIFSYLLEKLQSIEYSSFALIRKQQEIFGSILVVPGAIAAYRRSALQAVGYFDNDTIIEDYDMTIKLHKAGYKIASERSALAYVVAPQKLASLIRERMRWYRGGLQVMKKHSDVFMGKLGVVSALWIIESISIVLQFILLYIISLEIYAKLATMSVIDILSIFSLQSLFDPIVIVAFALFFTGLANTIFSLRFLEEGGVKILLYPLMAVYTSVLLYVFTKALVQEIRGTDPKWIKAEI
ncbi:MAG TPA: glycosyltransferase family 2 protein [archaeon]|nr:glycosyltransferase family 2 protein [archaeon]